MQMYRKIYKKFAKKEQISHKQNNLSAKRFQNISYSNAYDQ